MYRMFIVGAAAVMLATQTTALSAAVRTGTIREWKPDSRTLEVEFTRDKSKQTFELPATVRIVLDGKSADLTALKPGQRVTVSTTSNGVVTRLGIRSMSANTRSRRAGRSPGTTNRNADRASAQDDQTPWPQFRGPNRDNLSTETGLMSRWPANGPRGLWLTKGLGAGYSSLAVANGLVYTMGNQGEEEAILALNLQTGKPVWKARSGRAYHDGTGDGPRGTPTIDGNALYALGGNGDLTCADARTGRIRWQKNILQDFGGNNITWGICESVLIDGDRLICSPGGRQGTMVALDKTTGRTVWTCRAPGQPQAGYSSPIAVEVAGVRQYITFTSRALIGVRASDGEFLWSNGDSANGTANISTALFADDHVFSATGYGTGGAWLSLTSAAGRTTAEKDYHTRDMKNHHGGMILLDGYLYGSNDPGILTCLEVSTGRVMWQNRSVGKGALAYADGHLYLRSEDGPVALVEATPEEYREKGRFAQPQRSNKPAWSHPVIADGKLFLRDMDALLCYDLSDK